MCTDIQLKETLNHKITATPCVSLTPQYEPS